MFSISPVCTGAVSAPKGFQQTDIDDVQCIRAPGELGVERPDRWRALRDSLFRLGVPAYVAVDHVETVLALLTETSQIFQIILELDVEDLDAVRVARALDLERRVPPRMVDVSDMPVASRQDLPAEEMRREFDVELTNAREMGIGIGKNLLGVHARPPFCPKWVATGI